MHAHTRTKLAWLAMWILGRKSTDHESGLANLARRVVAFLRPSPEQPTSERVGHRRLNVAPAASLFMAGDALLLINDLNPTSLTPGDDPGKGTLGGSTCSRLLLRCRDDHSQSTTNIPSTLDGMRRESRGGSVGIAYPERYIAPSGIGIAAGSDSSTSRDARVVRAPLASAL